MLISRNWLLELVEFELNDTELGETLTLIGLEIDGVHENGDDMIFDIEVTSNRGDCLSHLGVARELAAFTGKIVKFPSGLEDAPVSSGLVTLESNDVCRRFTARIISGVTVGPSPDWLVRKLELVGERSINNIADITNLVMHELGQPMHAFDLDSLAEQRVVIRNARRGEKVVTLDEVERDLTESMIVICDAEKPVSIGGIMGGLHSGITEESKNVLLEVAYFERDSIRETSRELGLSTEASYRFERGVDIENLVRASNRAAYLIAELAGGTPSEFAESYPEIIQCRTIEAKGLSGDVKRLSGLDIPSERLDSILSGLGIEEEQPGVYTSPTWRHDLSIPEDLVEEVVRINGYDKIGESLPVALMAGEYHSNEDRKRKLRSTLSVLGFDEAISYSFVDVGATARFEVIGNGDDVIIRDPIIEGASLMRPTLIQGLLDGVRYNLNHKEKNLRFFEIGRSFLKSDDFLPEETELLSLAISGREQSRGTAVLGREYDYFDLKGVVERALEACGAEGLEFAVNDSIKHLQPGQSAEIIYEGTRIGTIGKLSGTLASEYKFKQSVFVAEINLSAVLSTPARVSSYRPLAIYPAIQRDVTMVVPDSVGYKEIHEATVAANASHYNGVEYVGSYEGEGVPENFKAVTIRLEYRADDKTLTDEDADLAHKVILEKYRKRFEAEFR
ncbi:MAG: phenylalanine--tRNA ligase subunit beta [Pyrinomonadaceae bacterium]